MSDNLFSLPIPQRVKLVEALWDSIAEDQNCLNITQEQKEELERRINSFEADELVGRKAEDVISDIRGRL